MKFYNMLEVFGETNFLGPKIIYPKNNKTIKIIYFC